MTTTSLRNHLQQQIKLVGLYVPRSGIHSLEKFTASAIVVRLALGAD
ncbi:MAG: hypothetical protein QM752_02595 [Gammaproteobacteria bacterium]